MATIGTTKHLDQDAINEAIVMYLDSKGYVADPGNVSIDVHGGADEDDPLVFSANVTECEDKPKQKRARKATQAEG